MRERTIRFGPDDALTGIVTLPAAGTSTPSTGLLLMSPGALHKIGNCRLNVRLARAAAAAGVPALRFDFSGLGDSLPRRDVAFEEAARLDAVAALDALCAETGVSRVLSFGLCSGADIGQRLAAEDARIVGLAGIDPWCYADTRAQLTRVVRGLVRKWHTIPERVLHIVRRTRSGGEAAPTMAEVRLVPPQAVMEAELAGIAARRVRFLALFTSGMFETYNYRGQYAAVFRNVPFGDRLVEHYLPEADHLVTDPTHQAWMLEQITQWAVSCARE
jgi:pimeloyl-ACP methyl ester carboxylesterase